MFNQYPYINYNDFNLDWIIAHFKEFIEEIASLNEWRATHEEEYEELKALYDQLERGELPSATYKEIKNWVSRHMVEIIGDAIKTVFFNLTEDGHFIAVIPDSWSELIFGTTGLDTFPVGYSFGHLTINY